MLTSLRKNWIDWIVLLLVVLVVAITILALVSALKDGICSNKFECADIAVRQCIESERYSREECILLSAERND